MKKGDLVVAPFAWSDGTCEFCQQGLQTSCLHGGSWGGTTLDGGQGEAPDNPDAMAAVEGIEGWRTLGDNLIETIINKSESVKDLKNKAQDKELTPKQKKQLTEAEKEYKSTRKLVQEKLIKFATRIPAFMYLTDFRENTLQDASRNWSRICSGPSPA